MLQFSHQGIRQGDYEVVVQGSFPSNEGYEVFIGTTAAVVTSQNATTIVATVGMSCNEDDIVDIVVIANVTRQIGTGFGLFSFSDKCPICLDTRCSNSSQPNSAVMLWVFVGCLCFFILVFVVLGIYWLKKRYTSRASYVVLDEPGNTGNKVLFNTRQ